LIHLKGKHQPPKVMANTNANCGSEVPGPAEIICTFQKNLRDERTASESKYGGSAVQIEGFELARGYKLCTLAKTEETFSFYRDIDNYELFDATRSAEIVLENITGYGKADETLGNVMKEAAKMLGELKTKMHDANNAACTMRNCLKSVIGFSSEPAQLTTITDAAKHLSEHSQKAAEAIVKIAGIHTFANVSSLKDHATRLSDGLKAAKTTMDAYIKKSGEDAKGAQKDLTAVIDSINTEQFTYDEELSKHRGLETTIAFICEGKCHPIDEVENICMKMSAVEQEPDAKEPAQQPPHARGDRD